MILAGTPRLGSKILLALAALMATPAEAADTCAQTLDISPQERLLSLPWSAPQPPTILSIDLKAPLTLSEAITHQILPRDPSLRVVTVVPSHNDALGASSEGIIWVHDHAPRLRGPQRVRAIIIEGSLYHGLSQSELTASLLALRQNLVSEGAIAFSAPKETLPMALTALKKAGLALVRLADSAAAPQREAIVVGMRLPPSPSARTFPEQRKNQRDNPYRNGSAAWAQRRAMGELGPALPDYYRRVDGMNVSNEMRRRYGVGAASKLSMESLGRRPSIDLTESGSPSRATYMPEYGTVFIHHRDAIVPTGSRFIALGLHGIGGERSNADSWRVNVSGIAKWGGALIAPDSAAASLGPVNGDIDSYVRFLHRMITDLKQRYGLPVVLLGRSFGSTLARELVRQYPGDADLAFLASYGNPYTDKLQTELMIQQEKDGLMTLFWPGMNLAEKLSEELVVR